MEDVIVISLSKDELPSWVADFDKQENFTTQHIVVELSGNQWAKKDLKPLALLAKMHAEQHQKSMVVLSTAIGFEAAPAGLNIAPTLQEAYDLIEMDEIQRDLWK